MDRALAARDARVVFAMMDGGRDGVSRACRETGIWQIGNVIDWVARDPRVSGLGTGRLRPVRGAAAADHAAGRLAVGAITRYGLEQAASLRLALGAGVTAEERRALEDWSGRLAGGLEIDGGYTGAEFTP